MIYSTMQFSDVKKNRETKKKEKFNQEYYINSQHCSLVQLKHVRKKVLLIANHLPIFVIWSSIYLYIIRFFFSHTMYQSSSPSNHQSHTRQQSQSVVVADNNERSRGVSKYGFQIPISLVISRQRVNRGSECSII